MLRSIVRAVASSIVVVLLGTSGAIAQAVTARFSASSIEPRFRQEMVDRFGTEVEARLGTMLRLSPNLDVPSSQVAEELTQGRLDIAIIRIGMLPGRSGPKGAALEHPWTYGSLTELRQALRSDVGAVVLGTLSEQGVLGLGLWTSGFTRLATREAIAGLDDLRGKRIAISGPVATQTVVARVGVIPTTLAAAEVFVAVQRGALDGSEITPGLVPAAGPVRNAFSTVVDDPLRPRVFAVVVRQAFWMSLPYRAQAGLARIVRDRTEVIDRLAENDEADYRGKLEAQGVRFLTLRPDEAARVRADSLAVWRQSVDLQERDLLERARLATTTVSPFKAASAERVEANVFVATDRKDEGGADELAFGVKRDLDRLHFVRARVELPKVEPLATDVEQTVVLEGIERFADGSAFASALRQALTARNGARVLIHVHGYFNTVGQALRRTAALERERGLGGVVVLYSWPSLGEALAYAYDGESIGVTAENFDRFMEVAETVVDRSRISILVHSMGSRVWVDYIRVLKQRPGVRRKYDHVVIAAADVSRDLFETRYDEIAEFAGRVTVYAAESDRTLGLSETFNSGERLGKPPSGRIFVNPPIETVDATSVAALNGWWWHHSYIFETRQGLVDMRELLTKGTPAAGRRGMTPRQQAGKVYWHLSP